MCCLKKQHCGLGDTDFCMDSDFKSSDRLWKCGQHKTDWDFTNDCAEVPMKLEGKLY